MTIDKIISDIRVMTLRANEPLKDGWTLDLGSGMVTYQNGSVATAYGIEAGLSAYVLSHVSDLQRRLAVAEEALEPFANFSQVLDTSSDDGGQSSICLYAGKPQIGSGRIERAGDEEVDFHDHIEDEAALLGTVGVWKGVAASLICPIMQMKHFRRARAALSSIRGEKG